MKRNRKKDRVTFENSWSDFKTSVKADAVQLVREMARHFTIVHAPLGQLE